MKNIQHLIFKKNILIAFLFLGQIIAFSQIKVLNIPDGPYPGGRAATTDYGYHLNGNSSTGGSMVNAKAKLTNTANFGSSGTVPYPLTITDGLDTKGSITNISDLDAYDIIFLGSYIRNYGSESGTSAYTDSEISILLEWTKKPGKVLLVMEQSASPYITSAMGYTIINGSNTNPTVAISYDTELGVNIFSGVFGSSSGINQNGSSQGYFSVDCNGLPLGKNANNKSTILFNREYRDLLFADIDFFTILDGTTGNISSGSGITNATDKAWANIWAWAVNEVVNQVDPGITTTAGIAYTDQTLPLSTGQDAVMSLKHNNEKIVRWETSIDGGITWVTINNTALTITYNNPQNGQMFRAVVGNLPQCAESNSTPVTITVADCTNSGITSVDLNSLYTRSLPTGVVLEWWTSPTRDLPPTPGTKVTDPTNVTVSGTYYVFFYDTVNDCYNTDNSTASVVVNILPPCDNICTQPGDFSADGIPTKVGITVQQKQAAWPESIPNGFITLEAKEKGLVITRVQSSYDIAEPKEGMLIYDIEDACVKLYNGIIWNCITQSCNTSTFTLYCSYQIMSSVFFAEQGFPVIGTIKIPYVHGDGSSYPAQVIHSTGVTGITATIPAGTLEAEGGFIELQFSGTPADMGTAHFQIEINGQICVVSFQVVRVDEIP